jgi:hypothetical protein
VDRLTGRVTDGAKDVPAVLDPGDILGHALTEEDEALVDEAEVLRRPALPTAVEPRGGRVHAMYCGAPTLVDMESCMANQPQEEVGAVPESCTPAIHGDPDRASVRRSRMPEMWLDGAMAPRFGVHIRRSGWEPFQRDRGVDVERLLDDHGSMRAHTIPDDAHGPCDVPLHVAEGDTHRSSAHAMRTMTRGDVAGQRQAAVGATINRRRWWGGVLFGLQEPRYPCCCSPN